MPPPADVLAFFRIDPAAAAPPSQQVHDAVIGAVADGRLVPGAKLPTTRGLAAHLGIAVNTVASAYRQLEAAAIVEGRGRAGTFVRLDAGGDPVEAEARRIAGDAARALARLGIGRERAAALLGEAFAAID
ncbi:GntR family transcriptional regulator [Leucobacter sp. gxy201]|uniref:GntR family transcriptional regulator n=1 Tax=Leucobacter sp. gxy201 TaxID=2957200 RepID=UPI003DA062CA